MSLDLVTLALAKKHADNCSPVISAPIYRSEGNKHYINLRELVPNALYSTPKEIILQNSIANFNLVVLADDGTEQFIYATTRSELFYVSKIGSFLLLFIQGLSYYVQINCRNTATSTDITFNRYVQYLSSSINYEFTPTKDYHPATKKYVDDAVANIDIPEVSVDGFISYAEAQNLTKEQRKQARDNIAEKQYSWMEVKASSYAKIKIADFSADVNASCKVDMELANTIPSISKPTYSSLGVIAYQLSAVGGGTYNATNIKDIVDEYENMKVNGCLGGDNVYFAIGNTDGSVKIEFVISPMSGDQTHMINIYGGASADKFLGYVRWDNNTSTITNDKITRQYIDTTLTKVNYYADAKAVGDRLAALEARIAALEGNAQ